MTSDQFVLPFFGNRAASGDPYTEVVEARLRADQLNLISRYTPAMMLANVWNAAILMMSMVESEHPSYVVAWAVMVICISVATFARRMHLMHRPQPKTVSENGPARVVAHAFVLGLLWGLAPALFFGDAGPSLQLIITCVVAGMLGGGAFALASVPLAGAVFILSIYAGIMIALAMVPGPASTTMMVLISVYAGILMRSTFVQASQLRARVERQVQVEQEARHDSLTRLINRKSFQTELREATTRYERTAEPFSLFYVDLDGFKRVNDRFGHRAGDEMLVEAADRLLAAVRATDCVARLGGDEFAVLLSGLDSPSECVQIAERVITAISQPVTIEGVQVSIGACVGIATAPNNGTDGETVLECADIALYRAKRSGAGNYRFFDPSTDVSARERRELKEDLRDALVNGGLSLAFQPQYDLARENICGFEALVRWKHPVRGCISPESFIDIAESSGQIHALGEWVLGEACAHACGWPDHVRLAVNVSAVQLRSPSFLSMVLATLERTGFPARRLELEITESILISDYDVARATLQALWSAGIRVALDDFGTGHASLTYLRKLPLNGLKIDRSFVSELTSDPQSVAIVRAIVRLAHDLGLEVIAEGVEERGQLNVLRSLDCDQVQGYLLSPPVEADQAETLLAAGAPRVIRAA